MSYYDQLRDPRWQRKRLEVMQRDGFRCRDCGDDSTTLNVHHGYYAKGRKPWEYELESLYTLCEPCHETTTGRIAEIHRYMGLLQSHDHDRLLGFLRALAISATWPSDWKTAGEDAQRVHLETDGILEGAADAFYLTFDELQDVMAKDGTVGPLDVDEAIRRHLVAAQTIATLEARGAF